MNSVTVVPKNARVEAWLMDFAAEHGALLQFGTSDRVHMHGKPDALNRIVVETEKKCGKGSLAVSR